MKNISLIVFCILQSFAVMSHEDTPLKLNEDGSIEGLPKKYSPASFDRSTFILTISNNRIVIPECIKEYFELYQNYDITFSGSWYHDTRLTPYYIYMNITTNEEPLGCQIFFNLMTLEIFEIDKPEMIIDENNIEWIYTNRQEISEECHDAIANSIIRI